MNYSMQFTELVYIAFRVGEISRIMQSSVFVHISPIFSCWVTFIYCAILSPFILSCLLFPLTGKQKVKNCWRGVDELYSLYLLSHTYHEMHVCLIALSINIITKCIVAMSQFSIPWPDHCFDAEHYCLQYKHPCWKGSGTLPMPFCLSNPSTFLSVNRFTWLP